MNNNPNRSLWLAGLGAIGASACCVGPLVLLSLGIGGAWVGSLTSMEPYRPVFVIITMLLLGMAYYSLYLKSEPCDDGEACANPAVRARQRIIFWCVTVLLLLLISSPYYLPFFL